MRSDHRACIGIPEGHNLILTGSTWEQRKGGDSDHHYYDRSICLRLQSFMRSVIICKVYGRECPAVSMIFHCNEEIRGR